jgi:hypothetical protein
MTFANYTDAALAALNFNPKADDVIARKQEILDGVYQVENLEPTSVLFVGFNPAILTCRARTVCVTEINPAALAWVTATNKNVQYIAPNSLSQYRKQFQCVVAMDEYFTFSDSDAGQQTKIAEMCSLASAFVISTLRDYKNQDFKDRDFSQPILVRNGPATKTYLESHEWDMRDRTRWKSRVYEISEPDNSTVTYGAFDRRTMFFKQLAKFSMDAGAVNFLVHKNLMYKSLIRKNYEHVVSIQFE